MPKLTNVSKGPRRIAGQWLEPGDSVEADGRRDWNKHPFVIEGWVTVTKGKAKVSKSDGDKEKKSQESGMSSTEGGGSPADGEAGKQ